MFSGHTDPLRPQSPSQALQRTTTKLTGQPRRANLDSEQHTFTHPESQDEPILVHFNGHFNGNFNGTFILPNTTYNKSQGESDAQIAARRAMAKRSSRSYVARISRTRSRKKEMLGRPTKPGITLDTSFSRHKGNAPRQVFPHERELKSSGGTVRKHNWLGLGRSATRNKGLGITQGTPQPESRSDASRPPPNVTQYRNDENGVQSDETNNLDPNTATPGSKTWQEVSPWDRAIPIGISIPSDSVPDFSPYQSTRHRSESDATLVTPSIIITPANAMKSVWSPDTASDYTPGRGSSIYSRATFNIHSDKADVPPVPALPTNVMQTSTGNFNPDFYRGAIEEHQSHTRNGTLDSAGTAFEDDEDDIKLRDRITSTGTFFEEDEMPLRNKNMLSTLSIDTSVVPTPRRSQGWWNVITTPFVMSRTNSVWTQGGRNMEKTPSVPMVPQRFDANANSPSTPTTYIWSATEKSPSIRGDSPLGPTSHSTAMTSLKLSERRQSEHVVYGYSANTPPTTRSQDRANDSDMRFISETQSVVRNEAQYHFKQTPSTPDRNITSPLSAMSPSPIVDTATTGTVMMPRQVQGPQPIHVVIELQDRRTDANAQATITNSQAIRQPVHASVELQNRQLDANSQATNADTVPTRLSFHTDLKLQDRQSEANVQTTVANTPPTGQLFYSNIEHQGRQLDASAQTTKADTLHTRQLFYSSVEHQGRQRDASAHTTSANTLPTGQPLYANIEHQEDRRDVSVQKTSASTPQTRQPAQASPLTPQLVNVDLSTPRDDTAKIKLPVFAPPPTYAQKSSHSSYDHGSRASSPASTPELKGQKQHRKVSNIMDCFPFLGRFQRKKEDNQKKKQEKKKSRKGGWCFWCCGCCIIIVVLLAIIIPVTVVLTHKGNKDSKAKDPPSQWLNITGYPPIPTGISTIAQPEPSEEQSGCVVPATIWSCALPKEQQQSISPNKPDQPNFKLEITFENSTVTKPSKTRRAANPVSAGAVVRSRFLKARAAPSASPAPPSTEDMKFLGQNTDGNLAPFEGEDTPFFITFQDSTSDVSSRLAKRAGSNDSSNITSVIPPPLLNPDGTAAPANLYPLPSAQPLRLYNRGKADEHYGFYVYYDRAIFLKDIKSDTGRGGNPADVDGGSPFAAATQRCTFSQTRFLVQIWTKSQATKPLLQASASNSSETVFKRPGSFPYPVTVTLDRHGGEPTKKNAYCYFIQKDGTIKNNSDSQTFVFEDRGFGGNLVNPTQGLNVTTGPIDGGTGGCSCQWQNWLSS